MLGRSPVGSEGPTRSPQALAGARMTEDQADRILKELRTIRVCVVILAAIIALASVKETFNL